MPTNVTLGFSVAQAGGKAFNDQVTIQAATVSTLSPQVVPPSGTNQLYTLAFVVANLQAIYLRCNVNLTIKTNSSSSPANTINLTAGIPYEWFVGKNEACLFTVDVTAFYLTNATTAQAILEGILATN
jgi:hypothetical protein